MNGIFCTKDFTAGIDGSAASVKDKLVKDLGSDRIFTINQVHGGHIVRTSEIKHLEIQEADGIISENPGDILVIRSADCVPVLISSEEGIFAAVHAGWKGLACGIVGKCVLMMRKMGANNIDVAIGPAIGPCCFRVGGDVAQLMGSQFLRIENGIKFIDLWETAKSQALSTGVEGHKISVLRICTCCRERLFFSYRRQAEAAGRQAAVIGGNAELLPGFPVLKYES
jgi:polyphenol oxidase